MIAGHGDDLYKFGRNMVSNFSSNVYNRVDHSGLYRYLCERMDTICTTDILIGITVTALCGEQMK